MYSLSIKRGFTLIELMISIALGLMIVYVATAGFRVASQSITMTNRLAIENDILRAGCLAANERLDFWADYDNPDGDASEQTLRGKDATGGLPFTPMSLVFPRQVDTSSPPNPELNRGWDPQELWSAADPRLWWHGNLAEKVGSEMALGRYSICTNSLSPANITASGIGSYGTVTAPHVWHNRQMWGLFSAIGFYGFTDYMPQNTLFSCYQEYQTIAPPFEGTNNDGMPLALFRPGSNFYNGEGSGIIPGLWRLTMATSFAVISPTSANATNPSAHRSRYTVGYWNDPNDFRRFNNETINARNLLSGPSHWPTSDVLVQHFIKSGRMINLCRVQLHHPITGVTTELAFTSFSTTLRGARMQRRHPIQGGGWAEYDNRIGVVNDKTLDDTP